MMRRMVVAIGVMAVLGSFARVHAQQTSGEESLGEKCLVQACFYECKPEGNPPSTNPINNSNFFWNEITSLKLANVSDRDIDVVVNYYDGQENPLTSSELRLTSHKIDELNVCSTLRQRSNPPLNFSDVAEGLITITALPPEDEGGVVAWMKNLLGEFHATQPNHSRV